MNKSVISLTTGLEDAEKVTVAFLVAVGAAESGRPTLMFLTKESVRLAMKGVATGTACQGCPSLENLMGRYVAAGGTYLVCPICVDAKHLTDSPLIEGATKGGTVPMWEWIGEGPLRSATEPERYSSARRLRPQTPAPCASPNSGLTNPGPIRGKAMRGCHHRPCTHRASRRQPSSEYGQQHTPTKRHRDKTYGASDT